MVPSRLAARKMGNKPEVKKGKKVSWKIVVVLIFLPVFLIVLFFIFSPKIWDGKKKITSVSQSDNGSVTVTVFDPSTPQITTIKIPAEVEVDAANQLGTWKLGSISKLGKDKKLGSVFLKNTIIKSFGFPIDVTDGGDSELSLLDKIRIALFRLSVGDTGNMVINLTDTSYLERVSLFDGSLGYRISGDMPTSLLSYFDRNILSENLNVLINNSTGSNEEGVMVEKVLATLGLKVASVQNLDNSNFDCKVVGSRSDWVSQIARILSCKEVLQKGSNNFDIEIDLGTSFKGRF